MSIALANFAVGGAGTISLGAVVSSAFNATAGNTIVVFYRDQSASLGNIVNVTDTALNTYTQIPGSFQVSQNNGVKVVAFIATNITGNAANIVAVNLTVSSTQTGMCVYEFSGTTGVVAAVATGASTVQTTITTGSMSLAQPNAAICSMATFRQSGQTFTAQAGYSLDNASFPAAGTGNYCGAEHLLASVLQTGVTVSMTSTVATAQGVIAAVALLGTSQPTGNAPSWLTLHLSGMKGTKRIN